MKRSKLRKVSKAPIAKLKKELDRVFSLYIRQKYADKNGYVRCYTCPKILEWKSIQCGHFVSRQHLATRFDEENVRPQCVGCNVFGGGRASTFANNLESERKGIVATLYRKSGTIVKDFPYQALIEKYKKELEKMK